MHPPFVGLQLGRRREGLRAVLVGADVLGHLVSVVNVIVDLLAVGGLKGAALLGTLEVALVVHDPHVHVEELVLLEDALTLGTDPLVGVAVKGANVRAQADATDEEEEGERKIDNNYN